LIGVTTAIISPTGANAGIGFAIPADVVNEVVPELIENGRVPTPGIGILAADETITAQLGIDGVVVAEVIPGSPAADAGLRGIDWAAGAVGDVIVEANGEPVSRLTHLIDELEELGVGEGIDLTLLRGGRRVSIEVPVVDVGER
jgi:2-alkenal reductase